MEINLRNLNKPPSQGVPVLPIRKIKTEKNDGLNTWNATFPIEKIQSAIGIFGRSLERKAE